jgi:diguanylate cyclase (GGDEF)-like protein
MTRHSAHWTLRTPAAKTALVSLGLMAVAAALTARSVLASAPHEILPRPVVLALITATFFAAEQFFITIEFRRESHSLTFSGVPLALGVLMLPIHEVVLARLVATVAAFALQHVTWEKASYNTAAYCMDAALSSLLGRLIIGTHATLGLAEITALVAAIAAVDQLMCLLVLFVIRIHGGHLTRTSVRDIVVPSLVLSVLATIFAAAVHILITSGLVGTLLSALLVLAAVLLYRSYARTLRRHQALAMVHGFVTDGVGAENVEDLARESLAQIRSVMRATAVELLLLDREAANDKHPLWVRLGEDDVLHTTSAPVAAGDWVRLRAIHHGEPTLASRAKDRAIGTWLDSVGLSDAIVVCVQSGTEVLGALTVSDRLTDTATFTADDVKLLQTLTSHLAVSIRSARLMETLSYDATHDGLTGLANRNHLNTRIAHLDPANPAGGTAAVMLLDLDKFKEVNDVLGHQVGDQLLVVVADRLRSCLPSDAVIARLGGDEFAVLVQGLPDDGEHTAVAMAQHVADIILEPVHFEDVLVTPEVSIGIAATPTVSVPDLLRCADTAMYVAKSGDGPVAVYDAAMDVGRAERLALVADLRLALEVAPHQFALYYQPKVDIRRNTVVGAEALVRWLHPTRGTVAPDRFIPLAEAAGLIDKLTTHIVTTALDQCAAWHARGYPLGVAVNLSARNLTSTLVRDHIRTAVAQWPIEAHWLTLEITESSVIQDVTRATETVIEFARQGIGVSLDDFGTGYSSLAYLQELPVTELKIDRSFVTRLDGEDADKSTALLRTITTLGTALKLRIVAEGIETPRQMAVVTDLGCDIAQGYLVSHPLASGDFLDWLRSERETVPALRLLSRRA